MTECRMRNVCERVIGFSRRRWLMIGGGANMTDGRAAVDYTPRCGQRVPPLYRLEQSPRGKASRGGEANDLLFPPDGERALCRRQKSFFNVLLGAGNKIAAATQVELALDIFAVALNRFNAEIERMSDSSIAEAGA